jgi:hypothetical protein
MNRNARGSASGIAIRNNLGNPRSVSPTLLGDQYKMVRLDFIFFTTLDNGKVVADLVDPHGLQSG